MTNGSTLTNNGKKIILNRSFKSVPDYTVTSKFKVGINNATPSVVDTDLTYAVPISNGTVNDTGANQLIGSSGGDNTTDNTSIYKEGAGLTDAKAQNLIANATNVSKIWTLHPLITANITYTQPFSLWLYIKDATALAKFLSSGTALEIRLGSDSSNYYSYTRTAAQLATGWNWISSNTALVNTLTATGTPGAPADYFAIIITTNILTDTFVAGDIVYDLLRQWATTDLTQTFVSGYPVFDETNMEVEIRGYLNSLEANGFNINGFATFNTDATNKMFDEDAFTAESKTSVDELTFITKVRLI